MRVRTARSLLFLPATSPQLLAKAMERGADALVVDLEDSVPPARKAEARPLAAAALRDLAARGAALVLRVNADPALWAHDIAAIPTAIAVTVMLPKVEVAAQVAALAARLGPQATIAALVETPRGVLEAPRIAAAPSLCALGFGAEDYAAAVGLAPAPASLSVPAQMVGIAAHAHGLAFWGLAGSVAETADMEAFGALVRLSRQIGFTGSVCIHPRQVPVVNAGFGPTPEEIAWARRVVAAAEEARGRGEGAILLDGRMIDRPIEDRAQRWLAGVAAR